MNKNINIIDKNNFKIDAELVFSFSIDETKYIVLDYSLPLFTCIFSFNMLYLFIVFETFLRRIYFEKSPFLLIRSFKSIMYVFGIYKT